MASQSEDSSINTNGETTLDSNARAIEQSY